MAAFLLHEKEREVKGICRKTHLKWRLVSFFVIEVMDLEKGRESAEEKLKKIMIKDLIAKDNAMDSWEMAEFLDF